MTDLPAHRPLALSCTLLLAAFAAGAFAGSAPVSRRAAASRHGGPNGWTGGNASTSLHVEQLSHQANVPLKHAACPGDPACRDHYLVGGGAAGPLFVPFEFSLHCATGETAELIRYRMDGGALTNVLAWETESGTYEDQVNVYVFPKRRLEEACQEVFGGSWPPRGEHHNGRSSVVTSVGTTMEVWGRCTGEDKGVHDELAVSLDATCVDHDF
ncbi:MAG: hypothetical protein R2991_14705 [Thermoanaerobaculia bacterium]